MKRYYRVVLGKNHVYAGQCYEKSIVGVNYDIDQDLSDHLPEDWRAFNKQFIPVFLKKLPDKSKVAAGLACGAVWTLAKGVLEGDIVLSPDGTGAYMVGEVVGGYQHQSDSPLQHQRPVKWFDRRILRSEMSDTLSKSLIAPGIVSNITQYGQELENLIAGIEPPVVFSNLPDVEDPSAFAMEKHLEDFLVENWRLTPFGKSFRIYEEEGERVGQQFQTDTGAIDILAISKDQKTLLVIELKKGRASDAVVGQTLRYMGFVKAELSEPDQIVKGVIIAMEDDIRLQRALSVVNGIDFYRYEVSFKLKKV